MTVPRWKRFIKRMAALVLGRALRPLLRLTYRYASTLSLQRASAWRRKLWFLRQWVHPPLHIAPPHIARATLPTGKKVWVNLSEMTGGDVYYGVPRMDEAERRILRKLLRAGDTVIDVGANIGLYTLVASDVVGPEGHIVAFEPWEFTRNLLAKTIAENGLSNVVLEGAALSSKERKASLFLNSQSGCTSLGDTKRGTICGTEVVSLTTLDLYVERHNLSTIDLVKIDVEGFEGDVLRGASATLHDFNPILFIELDPKNISVGRQSIAGIHDFLKRFGFRMWCINRKSGRLEGVSYHESSYPGINFVFAKKTNSRL